jgi:hypothetical protein
LPLLIPNFFNPSRAIWVHDSENDHRATSFHRVAHGPFEVSPVWGESPSGPN